MSLPNVAKQQTLCEDTPIGRVVRRYSAPGGVTLLVDEFLSVDVSFHKRHTDFFHGTVTSVEHDYRLRGPILELLIEVRVRRFTQSREPYKFVTGLHQLGDPDGPWPLDRFQPAPGILIGTLLRLAELSQMYNLNVRFAIAAEDGKLARAVFIPREHEQEIRDIAARITQAAAEVTAG